MVPLFKEGKTDDTNNYRHISILPAISKIIERAAHNQLYQHLEENHLLSKWQSGFRPNYSTNTAMTYRSDLLLDEIDKHKLTGIIFIDLKKAFDTVDHDRLIQKLRSYGLSGIEQEWFKSYLSNRTQKVCIQNKMSDSMKIDYGVPQGSILGPLLSSIFVNDLPLVSKICKSSVVC